MEVVVSDASQDASSPSPLGSSLPDLASLSSEERTEWRKTGTLPTPAADSSPAPAVEDPPASTDATPKAASEPAVKDKTEQRIQELLADRARERDRASRLERELAALRQPSKDAAPAASSAAPTGDDPEPDPTAYNDLTQYLRDQAKWAARAELRAEKAEQTRRAQDADRATATQRLRESWQTRVTAAKAKHADYETVAFGPTEIPEGSLMDAWILDSEHGALALYALQKNPAEIRRITALPILDQTRELVKLEQTLIAAPAAIKTKTTAPDPAPTFGTRATPSDAVAVAVKSGDPRAYIREANAREIAARKGH